jgi:hypothetical protein
MRKSSISNSKPNKFKTVKWLYILLGLFVILLFFFNIRLLTLDETEWTVQAEITAAEGVPHQIWHPPLYDYLLAGFVKLFGTSLLVWRLFGFTCFIINLILIYVLGKKIFEKNPKQQQMIFVLILLYVLSPLIFQQSLLMDTDNTIHTTMLILCTIFLYNALKKDSWKSYALFSIALAFFFLSKIITPVIFLGAVFVYLLMSKSWRKLLYFITASIGGILIFLGIWYLYTFLTGLSFISIFTAIYSRVLAEFSISTIFHRLQISTLGLIWDAFWLSLPFVLMIIMLIIYKIPKWIHLKMSFEDILTIFFLFMIALYQIIRPSGIHLKYLYPAFVVILIPIVAWIYEVKDIKFQWKNKNTNRLIKSKFLKVALSIFGILCLAAGLIIKFILKPDYASMANKYLASDHIESYRFIPGISNIPLTFIILGTILILFAVTSIFFQKFIKSTIINPLNKLSIEKFLFIIAIINIIYILIIGDYLLGVIFLNPLILFLASIPFIVLMFLAFSGMRRILPILIILTLSTGFALLMIQSATSYPKQMSWTNYGELGMSEVIAKYSPACTNNAVFLMRTDIGNYICSTDAYEHEKITTKIIYYDKYAGERKYNRSIDGVGTNMSKWYPTTIFYDSASDAQIAYEQIASRIDYVILDPYSNPTLARTIIAKDFILSEKISDFEIYKRTSLK